MVRERYSPPATEQGHIWPGVLIHGARAALPSLAKGGLLGEWLRGLLARTHVNTAVVALAAKMARIIWAVSRSGRPFAMEAMAWAG